MKLAEAAASIGAGVVYRPGDWASPEDGMIVSVNDQYVMVLYVGDRTPKATRAEDLAFLASVLGSGS